MEELTNGKDVSQIQSSIDIARDLISKKYYLELDDCEIEEIDEKSIPDNISDYLRLYKAERFSFDKDESIIEKFISVLNVAYSLKCSIVAIVKSDSRNTELYYGLKVNENTKVELSTIQKTFKNSIYGNFPGLKFKNEKPLDNNEAEDLINEVFKNKEKNQYKSITSISSIPSLKSEEKDGFIQGIEKLIEGNKGKVYSALFIADPISNIEIEKNKNTIENLYTNLSQLSELNVSIGRNQSASVAKSITENVSESISNSITNSESKSKTHSGGGGVGIILPPLALGGSYNFSKTTGESSADTHTKTKGKNVSTGQIDTENIGSSENYEIKIENKTVQNLQENIKLNLKRLEESQNFGFWNFAGYIVSDNYDSSMSVGSNYMSIMRGKESHIEYSGLNNWNGKDGKVKSIQNYIRAFTHPKLKYKFKNKEEKIVNPGTLINTSELAIAIGLPRKSVPGLPIMKMAEFGRNVNYTTKQNVDDIKDISIGKIYHLRQEEKENDLKLNLNLLTSHTFITGTTGSGKTNTIIKILNEAKRDKIKFLVIEPAKGEYKYLLGGSKDTNVFGTNPKFTQLLKINPFSFNKNIHVLEHMDRLVEIFNACWPMYAAMPAILKESIEKAYVQSGWDIENSINLKNGEFPTFYDLLEIIPKTIENSLYSNILKSDYMGALVTRVKSLTNGLFKNIFTDNEIEEKDLFDENCIIDISRVGSIETKSLLMGIIFLKLKEYREGNVENFNSELKHITVLEEAHNLLKRTSTEFLQESSNLQGKAVEMISNSIAEMRTYGEGFIIADQSPGLLDKSAIRNTGTKIIMKLAEGEDREIVGKSAALDTEQTEEIARLEKGVAVVYQDNWIEPVLCKIELVEKIENKNKFKYEYDEKKEIAEIKTLKETLLRMLLNHSLKEEDKVEIKVKEVINVKSKIDKLNLNVKIRQEILKFLSDIEAKEKPELENTTNLKRISDLCCALIDTAWVINNKSVYLNPKVSIDQLRSNVRKIVNLEENKELETQLIRCIIYNSENIDREFFENYSNILTHENQDHRLI